MIPACRPTNAAGAWRVFPVAAAGRTAWIDYIPVRNVEGDALYDSVALLLDFEGADGSTTFTDRGPVGHTVTPVANAQIDTAQYAIGTSSGLFDGTGDYLTIATHASLNLASGTDFALEARIRVQDITSKLHAIASKRPAVGGENYAFYVWDDELYFQGFSGNTLTVEALTTTSPIGLNTWHAVAVTREGTTYRLFADGTMLVEVVDTGTVSATSQALFIGRDASSSSRDFQGHIDALRLTTGAGAARYTESYTPSALPFALTSDTIPVASRNTHNDDGAISVDVLSSVAGLTEGVDYTAVVFDNSRDSTWSVNPTGYIPVRPV